MMIETAMRFAGTECVGDTEAIVGVIKNLERFVAPSHQLIAGLKMKLLDEIVAAKKVQEKQVLEKGAQSCLDLLRICEAVAPGQSRLLGEIFSYVGRISRVYKALLFREKIYKNQKIPGSHPAWEIFKKDFAATATSRKWLDV